MKSILQTLMAALLVAGAASSHAGNINVGVDPTVNWLGYINVFELPANGGGYVYGQSWGTPALSASFNGGLLTLGPCAVNDTSSFWYVGAPPPAPPPGGPGVPGNKQIEANFYVEPPAGSFSGHHVTFSGTVNSNTLSSTHTTVAVIKDFAPDYSSSNIATAPVVNGSFSVSLDTLGSPGRHVQYGFMTVGANCWPTDVTTLFGSLKINTVVPTLVANLTVNPGLNWKGYMNQFYNENDGGGLYKDGEWGVQDLRSYFNPGLLTLRPNAINPPGAEVFEYFEEDGVTGKKIMEANLYVEAPLNNLTGQLLNFSGNVQSNTLVPGYTVIAFIKDYAADYSSFLVQQAPLTAAGDFNISLQASNDPGRHIQYGFQMTGLNVNPAAAEDAFGKMIITTAVPSGVVTPFSTWIAAFDFSAYPGANLTMAGDPDHDGLNNLAEFALNSDPANPAPSGNVRSRVETVSGDQALVITLPVRGTPTFSGSPTKSATFDGVVYTIEGSNGLVNFDQLVTEVTPASTSNPNMPIVDTGWTYRTFRLSGAVGGVTPRGPLGFLRIRTAPAPAAP